MSEFTEKDEVFLDSILAMIEATSIKGMLMFAEAAEDDRQMLEKALDGTRDEPGTFLKMGVALMFIDPDAKAILDKAVEKYRMGME